MKKKLTELIKLLTENKESLQSLENCLQSAEVYKTRNMKSNKENKSRGVQKKMNIQTSLHIY